MLSVKSWRGANDFPAVIFTPYRLEELGGALSLNNGGSLAQFETYFSCQDAPRSEARLANVIVQASLLYACET